MIVEVEVSSDDVGVDIYLLNKLRNYQVEEEDGINSGEFDENTDSFRVVFAANKYKLN